MGEQAVRAHLVRTADGRRLDIPAGFTLGGDEAILRHDGDRLVVEAVGPRPLLAVLAGLDDLDEDWPEIPDPPPDPVRL